ncbi:hypothetical protein EON76_00325 [bacterium]|nr:MAG: hypothetical protein EON76_00325 [bacterium]
MRYYEDLYDRQTVEDARSSMKYYENFHDELQIKLPKEEGIEKPGNAFILNIFYMQIVGNDLLNRYENRDIRIAEWIARDHAKAEQVNGARLVAEPLCQHCGKDGLRIIDKSLLNRERNGDYSDPELVLFTLHCSHCDKNSGYWEDGRAWEIKPILCPKCQTELMNKTTRSKGSLTFTYSCPSCQHSYKEKIDLIKKETPDPDFVDDRMRYCLHDAEFRDQLFKIRYDLSELAKLGKEWKEREDNKHVYVAMKEMKKPKIAELIPLLKPMLEKAGYADFSLDKPTVGKDVFVGFNCLDIKSGRSDYDSRRNLEKHIKNVLESTNWRLVSGGVSYRLGYLNGRLRAYEQEDDLKQLIVKNKKLMNKGDGLDATNRAPRDQWRAKGNNGEDIIF